MNSEAFSIDNAYEIADRIWWVGHYLKDDLFQCHVYLIENGDNSILIDPGSKLTFKYTLRKIEEVVPFTSIKYFVCQHQDPDITGAFTLIDQMVSRPDAVILSHWRAIALLKHYGLSLPFQCVEEEGWHMSLDGRDIEFVFTPYLHFPGAFCSYDKKSGILFSSDIFGGFTENWSLFAKDESYFESMRPFHEHYMPSREILLHSLFKLENLHPVLIAPQHGSIIKQHLVTFMINQLKNLDCGLYMLTQTNSNIQKLSRLNNLLHSFLKNLVLHKEFNIIANTLVLQIKEVLPLSELSFIAINQEQKILKMDKKSMYRGVPVTVNTEMSQAFGMDQEQWKKNKGEHFFGYEMVKKDCHKLILPLFSPENFKLHAFAELLMEKCIDIDSETEEVFNEISLPLSVAVEREIIQQTLDLERQKFYEQAIRDPLTGLYSRVYMKEAVKRLFSLHDRDKALQVSVLMLDIDHFKKVNDTYGHNQGDIVLKQIADVLIDETRAGDLQVRIGEEKFSLFLVTDTKKIVTDIAERIRVTVESLKFEAPMDDYKLTISSGIAFRKQKEKLTDALIRADQALYRAKNTGRNRMVIAE